ncbi:MAG: hypothetical protein U0236_01785 [Nitrospira sp.]
MKTFSYSLVVVGMVLALGGVVAVFKFDQPSEAFSSAWWMIVGGWSMALTGMGLDILHLLRRTNNQSVYVLQPKTKSAHSVESEITRI